MSEREASEAGEVGGVDLAALKALAEKATKGKRVVVECNERCILPAGSPIAVHFETEQWRSIGCICGMFALGKDGKYDHDGTWATARLIAACDPDTILVLIAEIEDMRARRCENCAGYQQDRVFPDYPKMVCETSVGDEGMPDVGYGGELFPKPGFCCSQWHKRG